MEKKPLHPESLRNLVKQAYRLWHKEQINQLAEHGSGLWIALFRVCCWERFKLLIDNDKL